MSSLSGASDEQQKRVASLGERIKGERKAFAAANAIHRDSTVSLKFLGHEIKDLEAKYKTTSLQVGKNTDKSKELLAQLNAEASQLSQLRERYKERHQKLRQHKQNLDEQREGQANKSTFSKNTGLS